jgi:aminopeptidase
VDDRLVAYAELLVDYCIGAREGDQVLVATTHEARLLAEELSRQLARRGAWVLPRISFGGRYPNDVEYVRERPVLELPPLEAEVLARCDAAIFVLAPSDPPADEGLTPEQRRAYRSWALAYRARGRSGDRRDVRCDFPTPFFARQAGLTLEEYEDAFYDACLRDWREARASMEPIRERFDRTSEVRIVDAANGTDLTFSLEGREGDIDDGHLNMPGGEVFYCPVEDSTEGTISFDFDAGAVAGVRLTFRHGEVVDADATSGGDDLRAALMTDEGARRFGEFGIGCNDAITRHLRNVLFDEKMAGTIHLALGDGFPQLGGRNKSSLHWDLVKDLKGSGALYADGELVQERGRWLL